MLSNGLAKSGGVEGKNVVGGFAESDWFRSFSFRPMRKAERW